MIVIIVERAPVSLRGELTRWLLEPKAGVFVGKVSARVRQKLWEKVCQNIKDGAAMLIWSTNNEQGFQMDFWSLASRMVSNWDGLQLITIPEKEEKAPKTSKKTTDD